MSSSTGLLIADLDDENLHAFDIDSGKELGRLRSGGGMSDLELDPVGLRVVRDMGADGEEKLDGDAIGDELVVREQESARLGLVGHALRRAGDVTAPPSRQPLALATARRWRDSCALSA